MVNKITRGFPLTYLIPFESRAEGSGLVWISGGTAECRVLPPSVVHRGQNPELVRCGVSLRLWYHEQSLNKFLLLNFSCMNSVQCEESLFLPTKVIRFVASWVPTDPVYPQEKVAVMIVEPKLPHVMWWIYPFNKSFSRFNISHSWPCKNLLTLPSSFAENLTFTVTEMLWLFFP